MSVVSLYIGVSYMLVTCLIYIYMPLIADIVVELRELRYATS
jgi:hypothetical protein